MNKPQILIVDDDEAMRFGFVKYLSRVGFAAHEAGSLTEAQHSMESDRCDAVLLDLTLPDGNGLDWIPELREKRPEVPIIVITGAGDITIAVEAMRRGADNFLVKPVEMASLEVFLRKTLEIGQLRRQRIVDEHQVKAAGFFFGESHLMAGIKHLAGLAAASDSTVLLVGQTGTGKGMLARWIHDHSPRASEPFLEVNCSTLRGELLASELFGHVRGAFTSAVKDRRGLIEVAHRGTLFLDEIGDMDVGVQAQLLKVIEDHQFRRLGDVRLRSSDFRLLCASNRVLLTESNEGRFRKDLYFRINVFPIAIPTLKERPEDIPGLALRMMSVMGAGQVKLSPPALELLMSYDWPGNVREMRNILERGLILSRRNQLLPEHLPGIESPETRRASTGMSEAPLSHEETSILTTLLQSGGEVEAAATALGVSRATLYRKLKKIREKLP